MRRHLDGLLEPEELVTLVERLPISGWWVTTDQALYVMANVDLPRRLPIGQISSVDTDQKNRITTIRTATHEAIVVATPSRSEVLNRLQSLAPPSGPVE